MLFLSFFIVLYLLGLCERRQNKAAAATTVTTKTADERPDRSAVNLVRFCPNVLSIEVHVQYKSWRFTSTFVFIIIFSPRRSASLFHPRTDAAVDLSGYEGTRSLLN